MLALTIIETEGQAHLLGSPLATPRAIAAFHFNNRVNQLFCWSFWTWPSDPFG
jgi:hypothetical protein